MAFIVLISNKACQHRQAFDLVCLIPNTLPDNNHNLRNIQVAQWVNMYEQLICIL